MITNFQKVCREKCALYLYERLKMCDSCFIKTKDDTKQTHFLRTIQRI